MKKNNVNNPKHLKFLFEYLSRNFDTFIVLRGYQHLPDGYINDIDVCISSDKLADFYKALRDYDAIKCSLEIIVSRLGLIKCRLYLGDDVIPLDILYGFYFFGLEYQSVVLLYKNSKLHSSGLFRIPSLNDEIRISILKELLHNNRVRYDKAEYIYEMINCCGNNLATDFFSVNNIFELLAGIRDDKYVFTRMSYTIKIKLLHYNIVRRPIRTFKCVLMFLYIKYFIKNTYHMNLLKYES